MATDIPTHFAEHDGLGEKVNAVLPLNLLAKLKEALGKISVRRTTRSLRLRETLSLGEKRMLALVQVGEQQFLVAVTNQSIALLKTVDPPTSETLEHSH